MCSNQPCARAPLRVFTWDYVHRCTRFRETDGVAVFAKVRARGRWGPPAPGRSCAPRPSKATRQAAVPSATTAHLAPIKQVTGKAFSEPHVLLIAQWRPPARKFVVEVRALVGNSCR